MNYPETIFSHAEWRNDFSRTTTLKWSCPSDLESYAGGSVKYWYSHPWRVGERIGARRGVVPAAPGSNLFVRITTTPQKNLLLWNYGGGQDPHRIVAPVKMRDFLGPVQFENIFFITEAYCKNF
jgi:hypothetical protein